MFWKAIMVPNILFYLLGVRIASALQVPRQVTTSYTNTSGPVSVPTSTSPGPFCCQPYAPAVGLHLWYSGPDPKVLDEVLVTEFIRYNSTFSPIVTTK